MTTLLFLLTFLTLLVMVIRLIVKAIRRKPLKQTLKVMGIIAGGYLILWTVFYFISSFTTVPLGTDVCFDDWCATVTKIEKGPAIKIGLPSSPPDSAWMVLHIKMSNHARGIAQKPSEPRIHLIDGKGNYWAYSVRGQRQLENKTGKQPEIGSKLMLGESLETQLVYMVPAGTTGIKVLIEEGPFITKLLLPEDQQVFQAP
jgi:hypothetical protein